MPLKSQRQPVSRLSNPVMFNTVGSVEEVCRTMVTPGLDNLNRASRMGIRLKSVHMMSNTSHQRPMTTSRLHTQTRQCFENIVVPISSKHKDLDNNRSQSSKSCRTRSRNSKVSRLPYVPDRPTRTNKPVLPYYAENLRAGTTLDHYPRPTTVWTFSNQASRMEKGQEALNKCRHLKKNAEVIPHRVDRCYNMTGAPKKIHARYDIEDVDLQMLQELTHSRLRSRTVTPSTRSAPACAPPSLALSERPSRRELLMNKSDGLPVNIAPKLERETEHKSQKMRVSNENAASEMDPAPSDGDMMQYTYRTEDDSSVDSGWPPVRTLKMGDNRKYDIGHKSSMEIAQEENLQEGVISTNGRYNHNDDTAEGENHETSFNKVNYNEDKPTNNETDSFEKHETAEISVSSDHQQAFKGHEKIPSAELPAHSENGISYSASSKMHGEGYSLSADAEDVELSQKQNAVKSVEFDLPGEAASLASPRESVRKKEIGHEEREGSKTADVAQSSENVETRKHSHEDSVDTQTVDTEAMAASQNTKGEVNMKQPSDQNQRRHSESSSKPTAIFTMMSDRTKSKKDDVLGLDFTEERKMSQAEHTDSEEEEEGSEESEEELIDWDIKLISARQMRRGLKSSYLRSDRKLSSLRTNTRHLNAHPNPNLSWVTSEVYSFVSSDQRKVFEKHFHSLDENDNGVISRDELQSRLFENSTQKDLDLFVKVFDLNKDKTVDLREFITVAALNDKLCGNITLDDGKPLKLDLPKLAYHVAAFKEMFDLCDSDRDLTLTVEELMLMITVGVSEEIGTDKSLVDIIVRTVDSNHSGRIEFVEFLSFIPFFLGILSHLLQKPAVIEDIERARCAVRRALQPKSSYRRHFKEKTKDIWDS